MGDGQGPAGVTVVFRDSWLYLGVVRNTERFFTRLHAIFGRSSIAKTHRKRDYASGFAQSSRPNLAQIRAPLWEVISARALNLPRTGRRG